MNSRERIQAAMERRPVDRIPTDIWATPEVWTKLEARFGSRAEVRHCIDALASDGTGYILASCHNLQSNTPLENILALYDEAWSYGKQS